MADRVAIIKRGELVTTLEITDRDADLESTFLAFYEDQA